VNSTRHFVIFCNSPQQITANCVVSQLKESKLCWSKRPIYWRLSVFMSHHKCRQC